MMHRTDPRTRLLPSGKRAGLRSAGRAATLALLGGLALAGCSSNEQLFTVPSLPDAGAQRVASRYATIEVNQIDMPDYASDEAMAMRQPDGSVKASRDLLWADQPPRAMTLEMARYLTQITGAKVASEPWPFLDLPDATVEVRLEQMLAESNDTFRMSGQYFVAPETGTGRSELFDISVPMDISKGPTGVAAARSAATLQLSRLIASKGLR